MDVSRVTRFAARAQGFVKVAYVCVVLALRFTVSEWCSRGVGSRCYIGICSCKVASAWRLRGVETRCYIGVCDAGRLLRSSLLREVSCKTLVLEAWIVTCGERLRPAANMCQRLRTRKQRPEQSSTFRQIKREPSLRIVENTAPPSCRGLLSSAGRACAL